MHDVANQFVMQVRRHDRSVVCAARQRVADNIELQPYRHIIFTNLEIAAAIAQWCREEVHGLDAIRQMCVTWYKPCYRNIYETLSRITHHPMDCSA